MDKIPSENRLKFYTLADVEAQLRKIEGNIAYIKSIRGKRSTLGAAIKTVERISVLKELGMITPQAAKRMEEWVREAAGVRKKIRDYNL